MKSEYFVLLPNDICCFLQSFAAIALKSKKLWRKICHSLILLYQSKFREKEQFFVACLPPQKKNNNNNNNSPSANFMSKSCSNGKEILPKSVRNHTRAVSAE